MKNSSPTAICVITTGNGAKEDILHRISKAKGAFAQLNKICNSWISSLKTKLRFFNSNVKTVLLYRLETWLGTEVLTNKIQMLKPSYENLAFKIKNKRRTSGEMLSAPN